MDNTEWSFENLNSICWAIGSISGCLPETDEKSFVIHTIRTLLNLCEQKKGKENKAVVASNIMYVVGQYPKFLKANWNFLKTVIRKLFEFMKESFPGVMEMSCNTFVRISKQCGLEFVIQQKNQDNITEHEPYIYELIRTIPQETSMLDDSNKLTFYESLGHIVRAEPNLQVRASLVRLLLGSLIEQFEALSLRAKSDAATLNDEQAKSWLLFLLKINERVAYSVGFAYLEVLQLLAPVLLQYYNFFGASIISMAQQQGQHVLAWHTVKKMRAFKKETLRLMQTFFNALDSNESNAAMVTSIVVQPLSDLLADYQNSPPELREADVLLLFAKAFEKLGVHLSETVPQIMRVVFDSTISMISQDFNSYPDHRQYFFEFIKTSVTHEFAALFNMPPEQFKLMIDCVIWAFKHHLPNLQELGLDVMIYLLKNLTVNAEVANQFYQLYYMRLLQDILEILTDSLHKSGFKLQAQILFILMQVAQSQAFVVRLGPEGETNPQYVYRYLVQTLSQAFSNISTAKTEQHIKNMFNATNNFQEFKHELRDYLINLQQFSTDNDHLYDEQKQELQAQVK